MMINKTLHKSLDTGLNARKALRLLSNLDRLFRLDPKWEVRRVTPTAEENENTAEVEVDLMDDLTEKDYRDRLRVKKPSGELWIIYSEGWKRRTRIRVEPREPGSRLYLTEEYALPDDVRAGHIEHLGREQVRWLTSMGQYLRLYEKTTPYRRVMRWIMNRVWLPMTPSQRRIALIIIAIQGLTLLAFAVAAVFLWLKVLIVG